MGAIELEELGLKIRDMIVQGFQTFRPTIAAEITIDCYGHKDIALNNLPNPAKYAPIQI
jgi:hypothetical protein